MDIEVLKMMYKLGNPSATDDLAHAAVIAELDEYRQIIGSSEALKKCSVESMERTLRQILRKGLTVDQSVKLVYIMPLRGQVEHKLSVDGELFLAFKSGRLLDFNNPYREGDAYIFEYKVDDGNGGRWISNTYDYSFFQRLKKFGGTSKFYGSDINSLDPGFAKAKIMRHEIKRLGNNPFYSRGDIKAFKTTGLTDEDIDEYNEEVRAYEAEISQPEPAEPIDNDLNFEL
jgi:hypothetical protein